MFCNNILFLILTRNACHVHLLIVSGEYSVFIDIKCWTTVLEGIIDRNASIVFVLFSETLNIN